MNPAKNAAMQAPVATVMSERLHRAKIIAVTNEKAAQIGFFPS